jgi:hypothetical protein
MMETILKAGEDQLAEKLLFIQGGQPLYQYRQILKLLREIILGLESYDKKPHLLDSTDREIP